MEPLNGEFIVNDGDHNSAMLGLQTTIDDQFISRIDTGIDHRRAGDPDNEGRRVVINQMRIELDDLLDMVIGRTGEPSLYVGRQDRKLY